MTQRLYEHEAGTPATDADIAAFESEHGITLEPDYKAFLKEVGSLYVREDNREIIEERKLESSWPFEANRFPGLDVDFTHFFDPKFLRIGYVVGKDGGGNPMLQLTAGRFAGKIAMLDHEVYYGLMDEVLLIENGYYPDDESETVEFESFDGATDEQIIVECEKSGALALYDMTFGEFMLQLDELCTAAHLAGSDKN